VRNTAEHGDRANGEGAVAALAAEQLLEREPNLGWNPGGIVLRRLPSSH
jgi:hypothetical protein